MNIFIMILFAMLMAGYYIIRSPNQYIEKHDTQYAVTMSDLRTVAQCATAMHNAQINGTEFQDVCTEQYNVRSQFICLDKKFKVTSCDETSKNNKPTANFIVTATDALDIESHNKIMEILEQNYADAGTFGLMQENKIMSGGTTSKPTVPAAIIEEMELTDGQLVYLTQYEVPDVGNIDAPAAEANIICPPGSAKTYRFGRWQCIAYNYKTNCAGDMVWDSDTMQCVPDNSRKPLCADKQTAIIVDDVWECVDPFLEKQCPDNMIARLNYNTLEWDGVVDPSKTPNAKKCEKILRKAVHGGMGTTLRVPQTSCTDCEKEMLNTDTCESICVPDPTKITSPACYASWATECSGSNRAFYFGFPNKKYLAQIPELENIDVPFDATHSQNRRFNCLDCGMGEIDTEKSKPPYTAVCK